MKHAHRAFRLIPALLGSALFVGVAAAHDVHAPVTGSYGASNAGANAASQAATGAANSASQAARDDASGKIHIYRSEAKQRARKAYFDNREAAHRKGITDDDLKKKIRAAILKKYEIEDDPAPPAPTDTVASVEPPAVSPPEDPPAPPEAPQRIKRISPQELAAIAARLDEKNRRDAEEKKKQAAAAEAYKSSRAYDAALGWWIDHHSQKLPDGTTGLASEYNAKLVKKYAEDTGGVNLQQIWEDQERAKFTGETLIPRETPPPAKVIFQPQSDRFTENDPRPQPPGNYVPR
jgi:hypothetical protein